MKVTIEVWQSEFNGEWNCDVSTHTTHGDETEHWAFENFTCLLKAIRKKIPNAKCVIKEPNE